MTTAESQPAPAGAASTPAAADFLTGRRWSWQETQADGKRIVPDDPRRYTVEFQPDGRLVVRADCNRGSGRYDVQGASLALSPLALTKMMCAEGSRDTDFLRGLVGAGGWRRDGDELVLTLQPGGGTMRFRAL